MITSIVLIKKESQSNYNGLAETKQNAGLTVRRAERQEIMYRLQVLYYGEWKWGIREYNTMEDAKNRIKELAKVGIKAVVRLTAELFS